MGLRLLKAALGASAMLALGCSTPLEEFRCESSSECQSEGKMGALCEPTEFCSYFDPACPEDQRYGSAAGSLSNECVGEGNEDTDPDASTVEPPPDSGSSQPPDGGISTPPDGGVTNMIDAATSCVNVSISVFDDSQGNDRVKLKVNTVEILECSPQSAPPPEDSQAFCVECVPLGHNIEIKSESVARLTQFFSDCNNTCGIQEKCEFTATTACSVFAAFDTNMPIPQ